MIKALLLISSLFIISSCANHKDVRPGVNNQHSVIIKSESKEKGSRAALDQATNYCKSMDKNVAIISEDHKFNNPNMDEATYNNSQTIKNVATVLLSGTKGANRAGHAAGEALGMAYTSSMKFQCN